MGTIMKGIMDLADVKLNDQVIALSTDFALKAAANSYLMATLNAVTPEVSELYADFLTQKITAHRTLQALIVKNDWSLPYTNVGEQMSQAYKQSEWILNQEQA